MGTESGFSEFQDYDLLPIAVRAYAFPEWNEDEENQPHIRRRSGKAALPRSALIIDVETRTDYTQRLTFGSYRYFRERKCLEEGLFYADGLPGSEVRTLQDYVRRYRADVDDESPAALRLYTLTEFLHKVFYRAAYKGRCLAIGFNFPFDSSRLARAVGIAKSPPFARGFSFTVWTYEKDGQVHENSFRPRLVIKSIDSKRALKGFAPPLRVDALDQNPKETSHEKDQEE